MSFSGTLERAEWRQKYPCDLGALTRLSPCSTIATNSYLVDKKPVNLASIILIPPKTSITKNEHSRLRGCSFLVMASPRTVDLVGLGFRYDGFTNANASILAFFRCVCGFFCDAFRKFIRKDLQ